MHSHVRHDGVVCLAFSTAVLPCSLALSFCVVVLFEFLLCLVRCSVVGSLTPPFSPPPSVFALCVVLFEVLDEDGSGSISRNELASLLLYHRQHALRLQVPYLLRHEHRDR